MATAFLPVSLCLSRSAGFLGLGQSTFAERSPPRLGSVTWSLCLSPDQQRVTVSPKGGSIISYRTVHSPLIASRLAPVSLPISSLNKSHRQNALGVMPSGAKGDLKASHKPISPTSTGSSLFGGVPSGFLRRGTPKSKGSSPVLQEKDHEEGKVAWPPAPQGSERFQTSAAGGEQEDEGSVGGEGTSDSGYGLSRSESSHDPSLLSDGANMGRRGSAVSNSSMSQSPPSPMGHQQTSRMNRNSLSSFASSSGSPLVTASSFSDRTTIGDLSTASMPLLHGGGSTSSRHHADSSSAASFSDASSVHSYPPAPRPRTMTSSTKGSHDGQGLEGWKNWAREMEAASAPPDRVRRKGSLASDVPLEIWTSRSSGSSSSHHGRPSSAHNPPNLVSYGLSAPAVNRSAVTASLNPLAPLRKRLARSLSSPRRAGVELQLLLELIDALEHYIRSAESHPQQTARPPRSASASTSSIALDSPAGASTPTTSTILQPRQSDIELLSEIRSLVKELVECVPDAQLCLTTGLYGPLAFPSPTYSASAPHYGGRTGVTFSPNWPVMPLSTTSSMVLMDLRDSGTLDWWPRRLARDCRGLLEEVGFALGNGATTSQAQLYREGVSNKLNLPGTGIVEEGVEGVLDEAARSSLEEALGVVRAASARAATSTSGRKDSKTSAARKEELLVEGKKRWNAYRARQQAMPDAYAEGNPLSE